MTHTTLPTAADTPRTALSHLSDVSGRDVAALMNPRPVVIVGSCKPAGAGERESHSKEDERLDIGFATIVWATPLSHEPPLVAFALRAASHTMGIVKEAGAFSLSFLPDDGESASLAETCGNQSGHEVRKDELVPYHIVEAEGIAAPVPNHSLSWELCRVERIEEAGDHLLVIGAVVKAASRAFRDERNRLAPRETLLCVQRGCYGGIAAPQEAS